MPRYRNALPQLADRLFLTDGGIETTLIFLEGQKLPCFAAFHLLGTETGVEALRKYFSTYAALAQSLQTGLILETPTWRASPDWGKRLGCTESALTEINRRAVELLDEIRLEYETPSTPIVISGCVGPRGDGYIPDTAMSARQAEAYHRTQIEVFAGTTADLVTAITMNDALEAIGVALAAKEVQMPVVISFTVETDGKLPTGKKLAAAISEVDGTTDRYPAYYMINCAHPSHFQHVLRPDEPWVNRIRGLRANASRMSHSELDCATELDTGDPVELGRDYAFLRQSLLTHLNVMGGCCGTDHRHVEEIGRTCLPLFRHAN